MTPRFATRWLQLLRWFRLSRLAPPAVVLAVVLGACGDSTEDELRAEVEVLRAEVAELRAAANPTASPDVEAVTEEIIDAEVRAGTIRVFLLAFTTPGVGEAVSDQVASAVQWCQREYSVLDARTPWILTGAASESVALHLWPGAHREVDSAGAAACSGLTTLATLGYSGRDLVEALNELELLAELDLALPAQLRRAVADRE